MKISCSTSCIPQRDPDAVEHVLPRIDTDCFELFLFSHWNKEEVSHIFTGYPFFSVHGSKYLCFVLEEDPEKGLAVLKEDIDLAHTVEASILVLHAYNSLNKTPDLDQVVKTLGKARKFAEDRNILLSVELIPHIVIPIPELASFLDKRMDNPWFTFDLEYTSKFECLDEVLSYVSEVNNVHVRDYDGHWVVKGRRRYLKPLDGSLDFDAIFSIIVESGYRGTYTLEAPHATVEEVNDSMKWLRSSLKIHNLPLSHQETSNHL